MLKPKNGWVGVELRHFLALDAVASEASFNRAAAKLGYTQSAISQQIATLERVVGQKLIERPGGSQPVRLTRAGEIVMEHAHAIGEQLASAQADLHSLTAGELDPIRVGFFGRGVGALIPGICRRLDEARGDVVIRVSIGKNEEELLAMARSGEVDVTFVQLPVHDKEFEHVTLLEDEYVLVVRTGSRAVAPPLHELAAMPLIAFNTGKTCQLTDYFRSNNLEPNWVVGSYDLETIYAFVAAGMGSALLPRLSTHCLGPDVDVIELSRGLPPRRIGIAWAASRGESGSARAFVEAARAEAARFTPPQRLPLAVSA
jgi:DNA-binding transcriptional LysR family regulator